MGAFINMGLNIIENNRIGFFLAILFFGDTLDITLMNVRFTFWEINNWLLTRITFNFRLTFIARKMTFPAFFTSLKNITCWDKFFRFSILTFQLVQFITLNIWEKMITLLAKFLFGYYDTFIIMKTCLLYTSDAADE